MKRFFLLLIPCCLVMLAAIAQNRPAPLSGAFFVENRGQWPSEVLFLTQLNGLDVWITESGVTYDLHQNSEGKRHGQVVKVAMGSNVSDADRCMGLGRLPGYYNYFLGNDRSKWAGKVGRFSEAWVEDATAGIGQRWYFEGDGLRYDFVMQPGVSADNARLKFPDNTKAVIDANGDLVFHTRFRPVRQSKPVAYQEVAGGREPVACRFVQRTDGSIGFAAATPRHPELPLIIDPLLIYSTYFGSAGYDEGVALSVDQFGETFMTGNNIGTTFPTTPGAYDQTQNGATDVFVMKLSQNGGTLVFCTLLGGADADVVTAMATDISGSTYLTGSTLSGNFPTSTFGYDKTYNGSQDVFVTRLNTGGDALDYSTYIGGSGADIGRGIRVDAAGRVLVAGSTSSTGFPTTAGALSTTLGGGSDGFVLRLNAGGSSLLRSSFIGGGSADAARGLALGGNGAVYLTGTTAGGFPVSSGAFSTTYNGGALDGFVMKLDSTLTTVQYASYFGGSETDSCLTVAVSANGSLSIAGITTSSNLPTTPLAIDATFTSGSSGDGFFARVEPSGAALAACSYLGTKTFVTSLVVDGADNFYIAGTTSDLNLPVSPTAYSTVYLGGSTDAFLCKVDASATTLLYGTFLGGSGAEAANGLVYDGQGNVYLTGLTASGNFPASPGAYSTAFSGDVDAFVTKLNVFACPPPNAAAFSNSPVCTGDALTLSATANNAALFEWTGPAGFQSLISTTQVPNVSAANAGIYTLTATDLNGCSSRDTVVVQIRQRPSPTIARLGDSLVTGAFSTYQWYHDNVAIPAGGQFRVYQLPLNSAANGAYFVVVTDTNGCAASSNILTIAGLAVGNVGETLQAGLHPNPASGMLYFGLTGAVDAVLRDVQGRVVVQQQGVRSMDLSGVENGIYLLTLTDRNTGRTFVGKVEVQR